MTDIEWEECLLEPRASPELEQRFVREVGRSGRTMRFFKGCSWLGDAVIRLSVELQNRVFLEPDLADQVGLVVSQDNSCAPLAARLRSGRPHGYSWSEGSPWRRCKRS